jgi:hypothetical protein
MQGCAAAASHSPKSKPWPLLLFNCGDSRSNCNNTNNSSKIRSGSAFPVFIHRETGRGVVLVALEPANMMKRTQSHG